MALRADPGPPARVFCALGWKRGAPFAVTRDRVLKPLVVISDSKLRGDGLLRAEQVAQLDDDTHPVNVGPQRG
jgi:hypothetical protein